MMFLYVRLYYPLVPHHGKLKKKVFSGKDPSVSARLPEEPLRMPIEAYTIKAVTVAL